MTHVTNPNALARWTGGLYALLIPLSLFGLMYTPTLIVPDDIAATFANIANAESMFRLSMLTAFVVQLINIAVVLMLYRLLEPVSKNHALLMLLFLLLGVPITLLNELNHAAVLLELHGGANAVSVQAQQSVMFFLELHEHGIMIAQIFWGLWLLPMGYLVFKSGFIPKVIGILLMMGCFGYLADIVIFFLFPSVNIEVSQFTFLGELLLPLWLLIKGVNTQRWHELASVTASI